MPGTLISYRATDTPGYAGRLFDRLRARLPKDSVCLSPNEIPPGEDLPEFIDNTVARFDTVLVIIVASG